MKTALTLIFNLLQSMSPMVRGVLFLATAFAASVTYVTNLWADVFARVDTLAAQAFGQADFTPLAFVNYIFPFDIMLTFLVAYAALMLGCAGIRIVKSFIPAVAA